MVGRLDGWKVGTDTAVRQLLTVVCERYLKELARFREQLVGIRVHVAINTVNNHFVDFVHHVDIFDPAAAAVASTAAVV